MQIFSNSDFLVVCCNIEISKSDLEVASYFSDQRELYEKNYKQKNLSLDGLFIIVYKTNICNNCFCYQNKLEIFCTNVQV